MSEPLTQLEQQVYHFMIDFLAENTYQPSVREIARKFSIKSTKTVSDLLHALEGKGYIERDESRSRGVRLIGFSRSGATQPIAVYGDVGTEAPLLRDENRQSFITVDRKYLPGPDVCFVRAAGGGMTTWGILDGDYVLVSPSTQATEGTIVVARIGYETLVRLVRRDDAQLVLAPADDNAEAIALGPDVTIIGVVCGIFRPYWEQQPTPLMPVSEQVVS